MWRTGLVAPQHVGSSQTRARTHVPCVDRRILNHCATREAQHIWYYLNTLFYYFSKDSIIISNFSLSFFIFYYFYFKNFLLRYSWCTMLYVSGVQHSDSQFLKACSANFYLYINEKCLKVKPGRQSLEKGLSCISGYRQHSFTKMQSQHD